MIWWMVINKIDNSILCLYDKRERAMDRVVELGSDYYYESINSETDSRYKIKWYGNSFKYGSVSLEEINV